MSKEKKHMEGGGAMDFRAGRFAGLALLVLGLGGRVPAQDGPGGGGVGAGGFAGGGQMVRGTVTATAGDKLTVKTDAGEVYQVVTTTNTRVMKDRQPVKVAEITVGSSVGAMGLLDAPTKTVHAMILTVVDAEQVKKMREGMGKVYIVGKVTAIDETTLTILRQDGVTQKIEVDESTSFKRGGAGMRAFMSGTGPVDASAARQGPPAESITLMDIKVGDSVGGQGAVKNGVFVPKELSVMAPRAAGGGGGRRRNPDGTAATPPPAGAAAPAPPQ
jgi:hypothetical protein